MNDMKPAFKILRHVVPLALYAGLVLALEANVASAQTNTNSAPIFISFTNTLGVYITNAEVVSLSPNKLIYRIDGGLGGGTIRLEKLPPGLQAKFHYDPDEANKADQMENDRKAADLQKRIAGEQAAVREAHWNECEEKMKAQATVICARVIQRLDNGLLLSAEDNDDRLDGYSYDSLLIAWQKSYDSGKVTGAHSASGIVFLADYPFKNQMAAGDKFITLAYPNGFYKYTTVNHSESTIRRYTSDLVQAVAYASQPAAEK